MKPALFIAKRYLFAKKSHNVINIISIISAAGIAIGCAALIIILSVYNGFDGLIKGIYNSESADLVIAPIKGKAFLPSDASVERLKADPGVLSVSEIVEENLFVQYEQRTGVYTVKGVDSLFILNTGLSGHMVEGKFELHFGDIPQAVAGRLVAADLGLSSKFLSPLELYFPSRTAEVSLLNPMASLNNRDVFPSGIVSIDNDFDKKYIFVPLEIMRSLMEYEQEVTCLEVKVDPSQLDKEQVVTSRYRRHIEEICGDGFTVKDRYRQNESVFKILTYEKLAIYAILIFVVLIISCNVLGSLSMLVIEKKNDIGILRSMGADEKMIRRIFITEGWMISLIGMVVGIAIGLIICWLQIRYGFVKMPGNFIVTAYPVVVKWTDVLLVTLSVTLIGGIMAHAPKIKSEGFDLE